MTEQAELGDMALYDIKEMYSHMNIRIAVDDYGTGYSNVHNILRYMPNYVKIDRSLLSGIEKDRKKRHFVREIIEFCHDNSIMSLAEGVETTEELRTVIRLGVDLVQGYYTARPSAEIMDVIPYDIRREIKQYRREREEGKDEKLRELVGKKLKKGYSLPEIADMLDTELAIREYKTSDWHEFNIYSIGFFHNLGGSQLRFGQKLMKDIQNGLYLEVFDPDKLLDAFNGVVDGIIGKPCDGTCNGKCDCANCSCMIKDPCTGPTTDDGKCNCGTYCTCGTNCTCGATCNCPSKLAPETTTLPQSIPQTGDSSVAITAAAVILLAGIAVVATKKRED